MSEIHEDNLTSELSTESAVIIEPLSLTDKFIGVLTEPTATFDHIRAAGTRTSDWLVPVLIVAAILGIATMVRFSNPETAAQMSQQQEQAMQKQVDDGKMTQEQADETLETIGNVTKIAAPIGAFISYIAIFFLLCLVYWVLVRFLMKGDAGYSQMMSVVGLAGFIGGIDQLLSLLLLVVTGNAFANLSPALFMSGGMESTLFRSMMVLAPVSIWAQYVVGIGFSRIANLSLMKGMIASFIVWLLFVLFSIVAGGMGS